MASSPHRRAGDASGSSKRSQAQEKGQEKAQGNSRENRQKNRVTPSGPQRPAASAEKDNVQDGRRGSRKPAAHASKQQKNGQKGLGKKTSGKPARPRGPQPFGDERFGANLGPYRGTPAVPPLRASGGQGVAGPRRDGRRNGSQESGEGVRLQKVMAAAGVASRRVCEEMILAGRVEVDGQVVTELGTRVDPATAAVAVDGIRVQLKENAIYLAFNKPRGVVSTMDDPEGRKNISDFLKHQYAHERLFHVGRLDANTEGLLLLTNDGELANRLTHPRYEVPKTYLVQTRGPMESGVGRAMRAGIELEDGVTAVDSFKLVDSTPGHVLVEVVLHFGKNRIVRRLFDAVGYPVERLVRVQVGPVRIGGQKAGSVRPLSNHEVGHLLASVGL